MPGADESPKRSPGRAAKSAKTGAGWLRNAFRLLVFLVILAGILAGSVFWWANTPISMRAERVEARIAAGSGLRAALRQLAEAGAPLPTWPMILLARLKRLDTAIKAGSYELLAPMTPLQLLDKLARGDVLQSAITIPEGWTFRQMRARVDAHPDLRHDTRGLPDRELLARVGATESHPEGLFFPDTYVFDKGAADVEVYARAYRSMQKRAAALWAARDPGTPVRSAYELLILASIVEKETGRDADRAQVAAVFVNRLRKGMLLQTDPTVIYGLGERFDGNLRKRDLTTDGPYNSYTRSGLPPTPIALVGEASLRAVINPAASDALYFVARGDGSSEFSLTLEAHNRAVRRYQRPSGRS